jgi:hypothetical protein
VIDEKKALPILYVPIGMLFLALLPLPYGYYGLLKLVVCGSACYQLYSSYSEIKKITSTDTPLIILALFYNPLIPIHLGRPVWTVINLLTIAYLFYKVRKIKKH